MFFKDLVDTLIAAEFGQMGDIRRAVFSGHISLFRELENVLVIVSWELLLAAIQSNRGNRMSQCYLEEALYRHAPC
jgi:hypothetical protein